MSKKRRWLISTGNETWRASAETMEAAVRKAWKRRAPKSVGVLVSACPDGVEEETSYCLAHVALQWAGYKTEVPTLDEYLAAAGRE